MRIPERLRRVWCGGIDAECQGRASQWRASAWLGKTRPFTSIMTRFSGRLSGRASRGVAGGQSNMRGTVQFGRGHQQDGHIIGGRKDLRIEGTLFRYRSNGRCWSPPLWGILITPELPLGIANLHVPDLYPYRDLVALQPLLGVVIAVRGGSMAYPPEALGP